MDRVITVEVRDGVTGAVAAVNGSAAEFDGGRRVSFGLTLLESTRPAGITALVGLRGGAAIALDTGEAAVAQPELITLVYDTQPPSCAVETAYVAAAPGGSRRAKPPSVMVPAASSSPASGAGALGDAVGTKALSLIYIGVAALVVSTESTPIASASISSSNGPNSCRSWHHAGKGPTRATRPRRPKGRCAARAA